MPERGAGTADQQALERLQGSVLHMQALILQSSEILAEAVESLKLADELNTPVLRTKD